MGHWYELAADAAVLFTDMQKRQCEVSAKSSVGEKPDATTPDFRGPCFHFQHNPTTKYLTLFAGLLKILPGS